MSNKLNWCYYQGMSVEEAVNFINSTSESKVTERVLKNAKAKILKQSNTIWN